MRRPNFDHLSGVPRPSGRGVLHVGASLLAPFGGWHLATLAGSLAARVAALVYAVSMLVCFGVSATYHRLARSPSAQRILQRLDHGAIFVLIAGTYTPLLMLSFVGRVRLTLLVCVWAAALLGVAVKVAGRVPRVATSMYLALGWVALVLLPFMLARIGVTAAVLLVVGGVLYTVGAVLFFLRRPRLFTGVFGFHEFWHAMTLAAGAAHYAAISVLLVRLS